MTPEVVETPASATAGTTQTASMLHTEPTGHSEVELHAPTALTALPLQLATAAAATRPAQHVNRRFMRRPYRASPTHACHPK
jgi:hypothetical protein